MSCLLFPPPFFILTSMLPILLDLKFIRIYTFGVFLVLAFFWGVFLLWRNIKLTSYEEEEIFDGLFVALFGGLFFSRLTYVIFNFEKFGLSLAKFILINGFPGLSLYGALFGGLVGLLLFFRRRKIEFTKAIDYFIPPLFLSLAIGKIGSFLGGVDVGTKTGLPLAVQYIGYKGGRHPVALWEALLFALGVYLSYKVLMRIRQEKLDRGFGLYFFGLYFAMVNLLLDNIKVNHLYFARLNVNLAISVILTLLLGTYFVFYFRKTIVAGVTGVPARLKTYGKSKKDNKGAREETKSSP